MAGLTPLETNAYAVTHAAPLFTETLVKHMQAVIDTWFVKHFHNNPISRHDEAMKAIIEAKDDLKQQIEKI